MIEYTQAELERFAPNDKILAQIDEAIERDDDEAEYELMKQLIVPAESLLSAMAANGPDWVRKRGYNTSEAERIFGADWLDRDVADLRAINDAR